MISQRAKINKLDDIVNKYNNTYHRAIKMEPVDVIPSRYIDFNKKNNKDPKFKVAEHVRVSKCKKILAKRCVLDWSEDLITKVENIALWNHVISDLKGA